MTALETQRTLVKTLRTLGGRGTLGDLLTASSLSAEAIEANILPALNGVGGHLAVGDRGEPIYSVEGRRSLPADPLWRVILRRVGVALKLAFIAGLSVVLVAYFVFYVLLAIALAVAAIVAASQGSDCDLDCDCDCGGGGSCDGCCAGASTNDCGDSLAACFTCGGGAKRQRRRQKNAARRQQSRARRAARRKARAERQQRNRQRRVDSIGALRRRMGLTDEPAYLGLGLEQETVTDKPPFVRAVHDYMFGPPHPGERDLAASRERNALAYIRAHDGRITASDMVMLTGLPIDVADAVAMDLAAHFAGDFEIGPDGTVLYTFDRLLSSVAEDEETLRWIAGQGHAVSPSDLARRDGTDAASALARLRQLATLANGTVEHGATTRFTFPEDALERLAAPDEGALAPRDFVYCWEALERSPAVIGLPEGERGWVVGFSVTNLVLGSLLALSTEEVTGLLGLDLGGSRAWVVSWIPLAFSALVLLIPAARRVIRFFENKGRRRRNADRVLLLGLVQTLDGSDAQVTASELAGVLFGEAGLAQPKHLEPSLRRLAAHHEGAFDPQPGAEVPVPTWHFSRLHRELHAVNRARQTVDLDALAVRRVVFDTAEENAAAHIEPP